MKNIWYFVLVVLFVVCSPGVFFTAPFRNLSKLQHSIIHALLFAVLWKLFYDSSFFRDILEGPRRRIAISNKPPVQPSSMAPEQKHFSIKLGDGSK